VNDQTSGAGVILESERIRGILRGNALGQLQIVDLLADNRIKPGEAVLTAGGDQIFPRGLPVGTVEKVVNDPDRDGFIRVMIKPAAHLDRLDEVLVITSTQPRFSPEQQTDLATSEAEKGTEAAAIEEQKKASTIMAERLPGLIDPNLPPDQQPLHDNSLPTPVSHPPQALHPDRFTPGNAVTPAIAPKPDTDADAAKAASAGANGAPGEAGPSAAKKSAKAASPAVRPAPANQKPGAKPAAEPGSPESQQAKPPDPAQKPQRNP